MDAVEDCLVVMNAMRRVRLTFMKKLVGLQCYVAFVPLNKVLDINVFIVIRSWLKGSIREDIGREDLDVEIRHCFQKKMQKNLVERFLSYFL